MRVQRIIGYTTIGLIGIALLFTFPCRGASIIQGDVNGDMRVDVNDVLLGLKVLSVLASDDLENNADINGDGKIGMEELIYALQIAAGQRTETLIGGATQDATITVSDAPSSKGITPLLGVNAGPTPQGDMGNANVTAQYKAIGVTMVRTHDLYGPLDMSVMYPDRSKDPTNATSYEFTASDAAFDAIVAGGFEPYLRIGDSYSNVAPPATATERANWAAAAAYIVGRYLNRGSVRYVEVGNEPDNSQFWPPPRTTMEFFDLYVRTASAIKAAYPSLKVGGPGFTQNTYKTTSGKETLSSFLSYVKAKKAPMDFLSWHCYSNDPSYYATLAVFYRQQLDASGFTSAENHITEWNTDERNDNPADVRLGAKGSAMITASWIELLKGGVQQSLFFRGNDTSMEMPTFY